AVGRDDEDLSIAIVDVALTILTVLQARDDAWGLDPLGALRRGGHRDLHLVSLHDEHPERERFSIRRPFDVGRRLCQARDLRWRGLAIHEAHPDLRPVWLTLREIRDLASIRRPDRARPVEEVAWT